MPTPFKNEYSSRRCGLSDYDIKDLDEDNVIAKVNDWLQGWLGKGWMPTGITRVSAGVLGFTMRVASDEEMTNALVRVEWSKNANLELVDREVHGITEGAISEVRGVAHVRDGYWLILVVAP